MATILNAKTTGIGGLDAQADASGILYLQTGGTTALTIDASQNVGIGVTNPEQKLDVNGTIVARGNVEIKSGNNTFYRNSDNTNAYFIVNGGATGSANATLQFIQNGVAERMRIDASGNVGIGTSSLSGARLDIVGAINNSLTTFSTADVASQVINNTNGAALGQTSKLLFRNGGYNVAGIAGVYTNYNGVGDISGALVFGTQTNVAGGITERMRIDSGGNVGIGTNNPGAKLDVTAATGNAFQFITAQTTNQSAYLLLRNTADNYNNYIYTLGGELRITQQNAVSESKVTVFTQNTERMRIDSAGDVGIGVTSPAGKLDVAGTVLAGPLELAGQFEAINGAGSVWNKVMLRNDSADFYILLSDTIASRTAATTASWNALRPFAISMSTGAVSLDASSQGLRVGGNPAYVCRAWVNFDGTAATLTPRAQGNISSIADGGVGLYTLNFTTAMIDTLYATVGNINTTSTTHGTNLNIGATYSTTQVALRALDTALVDRTICTVAVFR